MKIGTKQAPILVAGGGIGGLATAVGCAGKGLHVVVLEKAAALGEIGAGIQLGPNAFHCFDYLGVGEQARAMAVYIDQLRLMDALTAEEITHIDLGEEFRARFGNPYAVVHRGDLHGVFLRACREHPLIELRVKAEVAAYENDELPSPRFSPRASASPDRCSSAPMGYGRTSASSSSPTDARVSPATRHIAP